MEPLEPRGSPMTTITAKYASTCSACHGAIAVGTKIEWTKGQPARHVECPARRTTPTEVCRTTPARVPAAGEQEIHRYSSAFETGATIHAPKVSGAGGGSDGHCWTVVSASSHRVTEAEDDTREGERIYTAIVRPATAAEATPVESRLAAREATAALVRDLGRAAGERVSVRMPETATVLVPVDRSKLCETGERVAIVDGAILHERVGDPDMCDAWYHYVVRISDSVMLERVAAHIAMAR